MLNSGLGRPLRRLKSPELAILIGNQRIGRSGLGIGGLPFGGSLGDPGHDSIDFRFGDALGANHVETRFGRHVPGAKFLCDRTIVGLARDDRPARFPALQDCSPRVKSQAPFLPARTVTWTTAQEKNGEDIILGYGADRRFGGRRARTRAALDPLADGSDLAGSERFAPFRHRASLHHFVQPALLRFPGSDDWTIVAAFHDSGESAQVEVPHLYRGTVAGDAVRLKDGEHAGLKNCAIPWLFGCSLGESEWRMRKHDETPDGASEAHFPPMITLHSKDLH